MLGPSLLVRTLSKPTIPSGRRRGEAWQYHPRSDRHSKTACWGVLLDLLSASQLLRDQVARGAVAFGINHEMSDFKQDRRKNLDLVLCTPQGGKVDANSRTFAQLATQYDIQLGEEEEALLARLPQLHEAPVGSVLVALEAKACMTAHGKAKPRLYDELNSSHLTVHGSGEMVIAAGFVMVNMADEFISPGRVGYCPHCGHRVVPVNKHKQPADGAGVIEKVKQLPRRASVKDTGFDALTIVTVDCRNDGSPVKLVTDPPAPQPGDIFHYDQMIARLAQVYESRFPRV